MIKAEDITIRQLRGNEYKDAHVLSFEGKVANVIKCLVLRY